MYKSLYSKFLDGHKGLYHFASHSHHFWPDISLQGQIKAWEEASLHSDNKWNKVMTEVVPKTQKHIARILNLTRPNDIAFASNTHELVTRLISALDFSQEKIKILTTSSEFHSFTRQIKRLNELSLFEVEFLDNEAKDFEETLISKLQNDNYDLVYLSHVFFNSGLVLDLKKIESALLECKALVAIDGYHAFCAIPVDLKTLEDKIFYLAGGYKYAQAGEGVCFMALPKNLKLRPLNTGWFAHFSALETNQEGQISYAEDGMRFWGSTLDVSAFYRFNAIWDEFSRLNIDVPLIHSHVQKLQAKLLRNFPGIFICEDLNRLGHFLTIAFDDENICRNSYQELGMAKILCDFREKRLRFGLGLYQSEEEVEHLIRVISESKFLNLIKK